MQQIVVWLHFRPPKTLAENKFIGHVLVERALRGRRTQHDLRMIHRLGFRYRKAHLRHLPSPSRGCLLFVLVRQFFAFTGLFHIYKLVMNWLTYLEFDPEYASAGCRLSANLLKEKDIPVRYSSKVQRYTCLRSVIMGNATASILPC